MEELSLLDNEELTLFIGSCLSLLFTCSFIYSYIKVFCHKLKFSDIPIIALSFCYFNNLVWYYYSDLIYHDYMKTCYSTSKTISFILIIIYLIYEFKEDKIDTFLNFGIIITVAWAIKKLLVDILNDEDKVKIACSFSQLSLITTIFEWIIRAYKEKNTNILNILCPIPLMSVSICWIVFGVIYEELSFLIPNVIGVVLGCIYIGVWFYLRKKYGYIINDKKDDEVNYMNISNENKDEVTDSNKMNGEEEKILNKNK